MAGHFVFQTLSSTSRSRSLLGAHALAAVRTSTPATRTPLEAGVRTQVARHFNTFPCSHPAAKTSCTATGMPSVINESMKLFSTKAGRAAFEEMAAKDDKFWGQIMLLCGFSCVSCTFGLFLEELQDRQRFTSLHKLQQLPPRRLKC